MSHWDISVTLVKRSLDGADVPHSTLPEKPNARHEAAPPPPPHQRAADNARCRCPRDAVAEPEAREGSSGLVGDACARWVRFTMPIPVFRKSVSSRL